MEKGVFVSVIIPVYNAEKYLRECLDSVVNQTLKDIEIICVDDGSTDGSKEILGNYREKDNRIIIITQENSGSGIARNTGVKLARGEFVAFMDADDYYPESTTLYKLYYAAVEHHVMICGGSFSSFKKEKEYRTVFDQDMYWGYTFEQDGEIEYSDYQFDYGYHRFIYNRQFLVENDLFFPPYLRFQDPPFFVAAMIAAKKFYAICDITYRYRKSDAAKTIISNKNKIRDSILGYTDVLRLAKQHSMDKLYCLSIKRCYRENWSILWTAEELRDPEIDDALKKLDAVIDLTMFDNSFGYLYKLRLLKEGYLPADCSAAEERIITAEGCNRNDPKLFDRINHMISMIPKLVAGGIRCFREHGVRYTWNRILVHLHFKSRYRVREKT